MLRTSVGVSLLVVLGLAGACSSKSTKDDDDAVAGKGSILGGASSGGTGGSSSTATAGTRTDTGGTATSTGGTANGLCPGPILTCIDATMATFCDPDTGVEETFSCVDDAKEIGFNSSGCKMGTGLTEDECALESVADEACLAGAQAYAFCGGFTTNQELFNIYVNCFQDYMDAHTIIPCFGEYVSETMTTDADCNNAVEACLGVSLGGAGAGGAASDPTAGAGGGQ